MEVADSTVQHKTNICGRSITAVFKRRHFACLYPGLKAHFLPPIPMIGHYYAHWYKWWGTNPPSNDKDAPFTPTGTRTDSIPNTHSPAPLNSLKDSKLVLGLECLETPDLYEGWAANTQLITAIVTTCN